MKIHIPDISDTLTLISPWTFKLYSEYRNNDLWEYIKGGVKQNYTTIDYTIPAGTNLKVDRIYIRKGAKDYSSVTFRMEVLIDKKKRNLRFWAKLSDVNNIEASVDLALDTIVSIKWGYFGTHNSYAFIKSTDDFPDEINAEDVPKFVANLDPNLQSFRTGAINAINIIECDVNGEVLFTCEEKVEKLIKRYSTNRTYGMFNLKNSWHASYNAKMSYTLKDKFDKEIASYSTSASAKTKAKKIIEQLYKTKINEAKENIDSKTK